MRYLRSCRRAPRRPSSTLAIEFAVAVALLVALPLACHPDAHAQGFAEALFGKGPGYTPPLSPLRSHSAYVPFHPDVYRDVEVGAADRSTYRTVCVRHCDGYYWPISYAASRGRFYRDAGVCRESCASEASLYYHPVAGDPGNMVDLTGRSYRSLPTAFRYREALVEGCKCKPEPWSESEVERHRVYTQDAAADDGAPSATAAADPDERLETGAGPHKPAAILPPLDDGRDPAEGESTMPPPPATAPVPASPSDMRRRTRKRSFAGESIAPSAAPFPARSSAVRLR